MSIFTVPKTLVDNSMNMYEQLNYLTLMGILVKNLELKKDKLAMQKKEKTEHPNFVYLPNKFTS